MDCKITSGRDDVQRIKNLQPISLRRISNILLYRHLFYKINHHYLHSGQCVLKLFITFIQFEMSLATSIVNIDGRVIINLVSTYLLSFIIICCYERFCRMIKRGSTGLSQAMLWQCIYIESEH